jgi:hypothetical protein
MGVELGLSQMFRVFENGMLRKILGPKTDEVTGEWRRLYNEELYDMYSSQNIIWVIKSKKNDVGGVCGTYGGEARYIPEGTRPLGRRKHEWDDNIKMFLQEVG